MSRIGAALRYRWKLVSGTFLLVTALSCWWQTQGSQNLVIAGSATPTPTQPPAIRQNPNNLPLPVRAEPVPQAPLPLPRRQEHGPAFSQEHAEVSRLRLAIASAGNRQDEIDSELASLPVPVMPATAPPRTVVVENKDLAAVRAQVAAARANLARLQARYTDLHPDIVKAKEELTLSESRMLAIPRTIQVTAPPALAAKPTEAEIATQQRRTALTTERTQGEYEISALQSDLNQAEAALARIPKTQSPPALALAPARPYEPLHLPSVPPAPAPSSSQTRPIPTTVVAEQEHLSPDRLLRVLPLSALVGFLFSMFLLLCVEALDRTVKGPDSLRKLLPEGALYLGAVGRMRD